LTADGFGGGFPYSNLRMDSVSSKRLAFQSAGLEAQRPSSNLKRFGSSP